MLAYSLLTRGVYGGLEPPWTLASYRRLFDPLYGAILLRSFAMAAAATVVSLAAGFPRRCSSPARGATAGSTCSS